MQDLEKETGDSLQNWGKLLARILKYFNFLPKVSQATNEEVFKLIEKRNLAGLGIGWIDAHLLASALISNCLIWTIDKRLSKVAKKLEICF